MFSNDTLRFALLLLVALVFTLVALRTLFQTDRVAKELGFSLQGSNGTSEFFAIYFGLWLATAAMAVVAAFQLKNAWLGDGIALLVLAQPFGRLVASVKVGPPRGPLLVMSFVELLGGGLLLLIRPWP